MSLPSLSVISMVVCRGKIVSLGMFGTTLAPVRTPVSSPVKFSVPSRIGSSKIVTSRQSMVPPWVRLKMYKDDVGGGE